MLSYKLRIFIFSVVFILLSTNPSFAVDGQLYFGSYTDWFGQTRMRAYPNDYQYTAKYVAGIEIGKKFWNYKGMKRLRPYTSIDTIMDKYEDSSFHPTSVKYIWGVQIFLTKQIEVDFSHMCWHSIDQIYGGEEQYNLMKVIYKFGDE